MSQVGSTGGCARDADVVFHRRAPPASRHVRAPLAALALRQWVNEYPEEILVAALPRDAHRRRVLEHQAMVEADRSTPVSSSSDPQLKIRLIGEVRRSDETVDPKRAREQDHASGWATDRGICWASEFGFPGFVECLGSGSGKWRGATPRCRFRDWDVDHGGRVGSDRVAWDRAQLPARQYPSADLTMMPAAVISARRW